MSNLKKVIAERSVKMMAVGLAGKPFHRDEKEFKAMMEVWHDAITHAGYGNDDAEVVARAWSSLLRRERKWFYPADLLLEMRVNVVSKRRAALVNMSDDQRLSNLKRLGGMMKIAFKNTGDR